MAWIRLDDDYFYHPKFATLSHMAFRLWHEGLVYCRKLMTDGLIKTSALKAFRYGSPRAIRELTTPIHDGVAPLWAVDTEGYRVHDYLDWNPSQDEEQRDRREAKRRMRAFRGKAQSPPVTPDVTASVLPNVTPHVTPAVPGQGQGLGSGSFSEKKSVDKPASSLAADLIADRAGAFLRHYAELYIQHRHGAKLRLMGNSLEFSDACSLVEIWDDARLEKLAIIVLKTDDPFISGTDRSFKIFAMKASWADDKLKVWEREHGIVP